MKLFSNIYLCHADKNDDLVTYLLGEDKESFWQTLVINPDKIVLNCNSDAFVKIFTDFFSTVLARGKDPRVIEQLLLLYELDYRFKNQGTTFLKREYSTEEFATNSNLDVLLEIPKSKFSFELMLPNYLLNGEPKTALIDYIRWSCWLIMACEVFTYADDIKRDIFNGHQVVKQDLELYNKHPKEIYSILLENNKWQFLTDQKLFAGFEQSDIETAVDHIKSFFPTADSLLEIINNHARAHRDEQCVDSFREPIEMIYAERYEELLHRDLLNDFRITYVSEKLGDDLSCTWLSKVYWAYKTATTTGKNCDDVYRLFELRTSKI